MKVVILAGGFGTRITEESQYKPKPMIEIGEYPVLWHIMKIYSHYGYNDFIILLGYKGYVIKEYFANYFLHNSDVTIDLKNNSFDFTWNIWTIEHYNNEDIKKILTEMFRVTENNWYIALWFPNFYSWPILKAWLNKKIPFLKWYKLDTEIFYNKNDILNIIEDINWIEIDDLKINKFWNFMPIWTPKILLFFWKRLEKFFYNNKFLTFISFKIIKNG